MTRVDMKDLLKAIKLLEKESNGGPVTIRSEGSYLKLSAVDTSGREMTIEISDVAYPMIPKVTKTETF